MGYDTGRFESDLKADLICSICTDVLEDPVQRVECEHYFCRKCITRWLKKNSTCPIDRKPLAISGLKEVPRVVKNFLADLNIKCIFATVGCQAVVKLDQLNSHLKVCLFGPEALVACVRDCGAIFKQKEREDHCCLSHLKRLNKKLEKKLKRNEASFKGEKEALLVSLEAEGKERQKVEKLFQEMKEELMREKSRRKDVTEEQVKPRDGNKTTKRKREAEEMSEEMKRNKLKATEDRIISQVKFKWIPTANQKNANGFISSWSRYLKPGHQVMFAERAGENLAFELVVLGLMVGPSGQVFVENTAEEVREKVEAHHKELMTTFKWVKKGFKTINFYDIYIGINRPYDYCLKMGGIAFSGGEVLRKTKHGLIPDQLNITIV